MDERVIVLNDQGGAVMSVSDKANTLRAQHHGHPPIICIQGGGKTSLNANGNGWSEGGVQYTLNVVDCHGVCYEKPSEVLVLKERAGKPGGAKVY